MQAVNPPLGLLPNHFTLRRFMSHVLFEVSLMRTFPITAQSLCLWAPFFCVPPLDIGQFVRASIQRWDTLNYKKCEETLSPLYLIILKISLAFTIFFFLFFFLLGLYCRLLQSFSVAFLPVLPSNSCNNRSKTKVAYGY